MNQAKWRFCFLVLAAGLLLAGCSAAGNAPPPADQIGTVPRGSDSDGGGGGSSSM